MNACFNYCLAYFGLYYGNFSYILITLFFILNFSKKFEMIKDSFFQTVKVFSVTFLFLLVMLFIISMHVYYYFSEYITWPKNNFFRYVMWDPPDNSTTIRGYNRQLIRYNPCENSFLECWFNIWTYGTSSSLIPAIRCSRGIGDILYNADFATEK